MMPPTTRPGPDAPKKDDNNDDDDGGVWVGLDLGTSNSTCAVWDQTRGGPKWCRLPGLSSPTSNRKVGRSMPSVVRFVDHDHDATSFPATATATSSSSPATTTALVGSPALQSEQPERESENENGTGRTNSSSLLRSVKRLLGKRSHELDPQWLASLDYEVVDGDDANEPEQLRIVARIASSSTSSSSISATTTTTMTTSPQHILMLELAALRQALEHYLDRSSRTKHFRVPGGGTSTTHQVTNVVVGVPAHFSQQQVRLLKTACHDAGFTGYVGTCIESTAAATAYGFTFQERSQQQLQLQQKTTTTTATTNNTTTNENTIMVIDMGGGTTDITIATTRRITPPQQQPLEEKGEEAAAGRKLPPYRVVVTKGDAQLGGDDIDQALMVYCRQQVVAAVAEVGSTVSTAAISSSSSSLWLACRRAKEQLCHAVEPHPVVTIPVPCGGVDIPVTMTQEIFETRIMTTWLDRARTVIEAARNDWRDVIVATTEVNSDEDTTSDDSIDEIILVGGTTRVPCIRHLIQDLFPNRELSTSLDPLSSVAQGLAIHAALASHHIPVHELRSAMMLDCTPHAVGVQLLQGDPSDTRSSTSHFVEIIPRNTLLPAVGTQTFVLASTTQPGVTIRAVEELLDEDDDGGAGEERRRYVPLRTEDFTFLLRQLSPSQIRTLSTRTIEVGMKLDTDGNFIVSVFDANDPEHVFKRKRFAQQQQHKKGLGEGNEADRSDFEYVKELIRAGKPAAEEENFSNEQVRLIAALVGIVILYIAVKIAFVDLAVEDYTDNHILN